MELAGVELGTLVSETDALTTRPPPNALIFFVARYLWSSDLLRKFDKLKFAGEFSFAFQLSEGTKPQLISAALLPCSLLFAFILGFINIFYVYADW